MQLWRMHMDIRIEKRDSFTIGGYLIETLIRQR